MPREGAIDELSAVSSIIADTRHAGMLCPEVRTGNGILGKFAALEGNGSESLRLVARLDRMGLSHRR